MLPAMRRAAAALLALLGAAAVPGCVAGGAPPRPPPGPPPERMVRVERADELGPYLDAVLANERFSRRFFFPKSADCIALLRPGSDAAYHPHGPFGTLADGAGARCEPVGVGSLVEWRDELPRRRSQYLVPRVQAEFHALHQGPEWLLVRGRFPLALEIRWPEPMDSVAVVPAEPVCEALAERGRAVMEYHAQGPEVFVLEDEDAPGGLDAPQCPIVGFVVPVELE